MALNDLWKKLNKSQLCETRSHTIVSSSKKEYYDIYTDAPCYSHLWAGREGMERLHLITVDPTVEGVEEYIDWVLNSVLFGEAFLTKSFKEGQESGYEVDINQPTNFLFSAMAAIRYPWESNYPGYGYQWDYAAFRNMGFSIKQSLFMTVNCQIEEGKFLKPANYNSNHLPIPRSLPFEKYKPECFKRQEGNMKARARSEGVTNSWEGGYTDYKGDWFRGFFKRPKVSITPEIINQLKKELKED